MNRTITGVLVVLALCVVGFGFYRGWFALSSPSSGTGSNQINVNLAADPDKVKADIELLNQKTTGSDASERQ
jgi:hypothetical protein